MFNNNEEIDINTIAIPPLSFIEYFPKSFDIKQLPDSNTKDNIFFIENVKNIFNQESLSLKEIDEEYKDDSIYYVKKIDNSDIDSRSTVITTNTLPDLEKNIKEKKEDSKKKIINFQTFLRKKRGKKPKSKNSNSTKKCHGSDDFDNIQRKIQVHFISFLVSLANDKLAQIFGTKNKFQFKDVKYELKRIVNHKNVEYLKQCQYSDIIQMKISPKNKKFGEDTNKNIYLHITQLSKELKNFFDKNYLYIFQKYYFGLKKDEKEINYEGEKLALSNKTKGFYYLLEKNGFSQKFINVIKDVYFNDINYLNDKKFMTTNSFDWLL